MNVHMIASERSHDAYENPTIGRIHADNHPSEPTDEQHLTDDH